MKAPNYAAINATREKSIRNREASAAQDEVRLAKQIQAHAPCTWTEALREARRIMAACK